MAGQCGGAPDVGGYVLIPSGSFTMGSPSDELGRDDDEGPRHQVSLTRSFLLKATEVTQGEWRTLMGNNPSYFSSCGDECPVETVNWWEALAYCNALSRSEGLPECYTLSGCDSNAPGEDMECESATFAGLGCGGYRLPTEAEWEYAYRAGTTTAFYNGGITNTECSPLDPNLAAIGWYCGNEGNRTHPVGEKQANAWGLYDMAGNVWEWTWDWYDDYPSGPLTDPVGPGTGAYRVARGGSWLYYARLCRAALRGWIDPGDRSASLGFRLARSVP